MQDLDCQMQGFNGKMFTKAKEESGIWNRESGIKGISITQGIPLFQIPNSKFLIPLSFATSITRHE
jgi:hypothetical protein